jgi:hypothetical protein
MMRRNFVLLSIGAALFLSLFFMDASYAIQTISRKPPVDFMTVAQMYGWTEGPLQVVGFMLGTGLIVLAGLGIKKFRHYRHSYQA